MGNDDQFAYKIDNEIAINLFNRYWEIFKNLDSRRIKSSLQLFLFVALVLLFKLNPTKEFTIPLVQYEVDYNTAILIAPLLICVFLFRFIILSALALNAQAKHNWYFLFFRETLVKKYASKPGSEDAFRNYELSELPNIFLFPIPVDQSRSFVKYFKTDWIRSIALLLKKLLSLIYNAGFSIFSLFPLMMIIWILCYDFPKIPKINTNNLYSIWYYFLLCITIFLVLTLPYYYIFKTKQSRKELKQ